ncbi:DUF4124 domain-containing protein [Acinetobacter sp. ANC 4173]|uniref:DUF4124 domain-containing protein n=1 Tax=Acinetobacter sp. ANC 4173 TaxID=2529837 RepID=UPI00103FBAB8|nr:DUF4124 domain-containing protein [Acinetobacter sp. ANC 4173]TCB78891.1 DUF4124 domain-containing protein [Acinetobacter sp. ANC 4173]
MSLPLHLISSVALTCALLSSSASVSAKDYYKWVDANGSTHYTTTPPPKSAQKKGKIQTYGWANSSSSQPTTEAAPIAKEAAKAAQQAIEEKANPTAVTTLPIPSAAATLTPPPMTPEPNK